MRTPYPKYSPTGIEWIGNIPAHWEVKKIARLFRIIGSGTTPTAGAPEFYDEGTTPWVNTGDLNDSFVEQCSKKVTQRALLEHSALKIYPIGSVVLAMYGATIGKTGILSFEACTNQACCVFVDGIGLHSLFFHYWLLSNKKHIISLGYGGGQPNISQDLIKSLRVPMPPHPSEQLAIVTYLNSEVGKIDKLISKKKQFVERLKEKRTALISQVITNGLPPEEAKRHGFPIAPKMKPSRVEHLGNIPQHWDIKRLRYVGECQNGISKEGGAFGSGFPFVSYGDTYRDAALPILVSGLVESTEEERRTFSVKKGDVLFTRTSETVEEIGFASTCLTSIADATFAGFLIRFRPRPGCIDDNFSKYYFRCALHRRFFVSEMNIVTRASLSQELLKRLPVLLPPIGEQRAIGSYLDVQTNKIDKIIQQVDFAIKKLDEYRGSLITSAVTGKIDVREAQA